MSYAAKLVMHASLARGGSTWISELTDFPGITVIKKKETSAAKWTQVVVFEEKEFNKIADAVAAWKEKNASSNSQPTD